MKEIIDSIKKTLDYKKLTLSVAESVTSGEIQSLLTSISGSSTFFQGGITVYNIDQKVNILNVDRIRAEKVNCVSQYISNQMSVSCLDLFKSDFSIAITGYSESYVPENIESSFCFYSIGYKGTVVEYGKITSIIDDRNVNRKLFTERVLYKFNDYINSLCII